MRSRALIVLPALAAALSGCGGGSSPAVELEGGGDSTGGKALVFTASTTEELVGDGGRLVLELRGIDTKKTPRATYDKPDYLASVQCPAAPCEWTVAPEQAGTYEFTAFLVTLESQMRQEQSDPLEVVWNAPPRPSDFEFLINGKSFPLTRVEEGIDKYLPAPPGEMRVEAKWVGDAGDTGYEVVLTNGEPDGEETCTSGTSCLVEDVPLLADQEMNWRLDVRTAEGGKVVAGFQVCLVGKAGDAGDA